MGFSYDVVVKFTVIMFGHPFSRFTLCTVYVRLYFLSSLLVRICHILYGSLCGKIVFAPDGNVTSTLKDSHHVSTVSMVTHADRQVVDFSRLHQFFCSFSVRTKQLVICTTVCLLYSFPIVGIQASRLSTSLHQTARLGKLPAGRATCSLLNPLQTFLDASDQQETCSQSNNRTAARVLLLLVIPGGTLFSFLLTATLLARGRQWDDRKVPV